MTTGPVEPQLVAHDRTAKRPVDVPQLQCFSSHAQAGGDMCVCEVGALPAFSGVGREHAAGVRVASLLGHDVHLRPAGRRFAQSATQREGHFLGDADFRNVAGDPHSHPANAQAIYLDLSLIAPSAVGLEHAEAGEVRASDILPLNTERGHERRETGVLTADGDGREELVVDRLRGSRALHIDERRFTADGDRFGELADAQISVDRRDEGPLELIPSRLKLLKPLSVNVTVYTPVEDRRCGTGRSRQ